MRLPILDYHAYGAVAELFKDVANLPPDTQKEYLLEGPSGTGKTVGLLFFADMVAQEYPGCRILFCRKTRSSMTESVLDLFETEILGEGHAAMTGNRSSETRQSYTYPNGSHIVLVGLEKVERIMSSQFDLICVFEATELLLKDWDFLSTRNRNWVTPFQIMVADCNPGSQYHWLNLRANRGIMHRLLSVHEDNPKWFDHEANDWRPQGRKYIGALGNQVAERVARLRDGEWTSQAGKVLAEYLANTHLLEGRMEKYHGYVLLHIDRWENDPRRESPVKLESFIISQDWGDDAPGVQQVWGLDESGRMFRISEVYRRLYTTEQWAEIAEAHVEEFGAREIVCDHDLERIRVFNNRLARKHGLGRIARKANKNINVGIQEVRQMLSEERLFLIKGVLREGRDQDLDQDGEPCCTEEEIGSYVWKKDADGRPTDKPDKRNCADHGCDAMRYAVMAAAERRAKKPKREMYQEGTLGHLLGHNELLGGRAAYERR